MPAAPWYIADAVTTWLTIPEPVGRCKWSFKPAALWPDEDLVAAGGDLESSTLIDAYRTGLFPMMVDAPDPVLAWWSPNPRGIVPLDGLRVTRSMRQSARRYDVRVDTNFDAVMRGCADPSRPSGWITDEFLAAYSRLHELGWAHSIEVYDRDGALAGGLYGVKVDRLFAGESMFSRQRDASKVALMTLVALMQESGMALLDAQWCTDHLASLGAIEIPRAEYLRRLSEAVDETR